MKYLSMLFYAILSIGSFILGRKTVIAQQQKELLKDVARVKKISDSVDSMSDADVARELRDTFNPKK